LTPNPDKWRKRQTSIAISAKLAEVRYGLATTLSMTMGW
jgi:hypothetical protein